MPNFPLLFSPRGGPRHANARRRPARRRPPLAVEALEDRTMPATSFLQGTAFFDSNGNNQFDPGETYKPGATIQLRSADGSQLLGTTTTGANGGYFFGDVDPGTYRLVEV